MKFLKGFGACSWRFQRSKLLEVFENVSEGSRDVLEVVTEVPLQHFRRS